jgi:hypothetical protein
MQVSEDVDLGSRIHAAGFKSVYLTEGNLATGEVRSLPAHSLSSHDMVHSCSGDRTLERSFTA